MKVSTSTHSVFLVYLMSLISMATAFSVLDNFLKCLPNHIQPGKSISGSIYTPNNSSFQSVLQAYIKNRRFFTPGTPKPLAIVAATHSSHVQATVICAKFHGLQIRIRSGGHDYEGLSYISNIPFVILDLFNLRSINVDLANGTAWVQAGATLGELYYKIANISKVHGFPAGVGPTIGTGGHFSGGGYGNLMRKYGLAADNIIDAQLVDVNGHILDRKSMGEDLFWAIRGGGGASFGVILSWKINLVRVPSQVTVFRVDRTLEQDATNIVYRWQLVAIELDKEVFIRVMPMVAKGSREGEKRIIVTFIGLFLGEIGQLITLTNKSFPELGLQQKDCNEMSWIESTVFWADFPQGTSTDVLLNRPPKPQIFFKSKSDYVKDVIPKDGLERIWKIMVNVDVDNLFLQWNPYGGRMWEIPETEIPFPHRAGCRFLVQYFTFWFEEGNEAANRYINSLRKIYDTMAPYVTKYPREAYLNYRDLDIGSNPSNQTNFEKAEVYGSKYFKGNFLRLTKVKARFDPYNFIKNEQSIPPLGSH